MKNFDWTQFTRKIPVKASMQEMYDAWTTKRELERWFLKDAGYYDTNGNVIGDNVNVEKGNTYAWQWFGYDVTEKGKITEANGNDHFQFTFAGDCPVDIKLTQRKDEVIVELTQSNIPTDDDSKINIRLGCHTGWSFFLANLKSVYEGGIDLRNKDDDASGMVNS